MTVRWITTRADFAALAPEWDAAVEASGCGNPFLLSSFLSPWAESFVPEGSLCVLVASDDGGIRAGLPLYRDRRRGVAVLRVVGIGFANLTEPLFAAGAEPAAGAALLGQALAALPDWRYLHLPLVRPWMLLPPGLPCRETPAGLNARIRIASSAAETVCGLRPRMQANLRRSLRHAAAAGVLSLDCETDPARVEELVAFQLRHNGPERYPPDTVVTRSRTAWAACTRRVLAAMAASDRLDALALRLHRQGREEALIAAGFGFRLGAGYHSVLVSYDPAFRALGPGFLFFYYLMDWVRARGGDFIEMYADGRAFDKRRWCPGPDSLEPLRSVRLYHPSLSGRLLRRAQALLAPAEGIPC